MAYSREKTTTIAEQFFDAAVKEKQSVINHINNLTKDLMRDSGYVETPSCGFYKKGEEKKMVQIAELPNELFIPDFLVRTDTTLQHFSEEGGFIQTKYVSKTGMLLDFGSFSDFESHSMEVLKIIYFQLQDMDLNT